MPFPSHWPEISWASWGQTLWLLVENQFCQQENKFPLQRHGVKQHARFSLLLAVVCFLTPGRAACVVGNRSVVTAAAVLLLCALFGSKFLCFAKILAIVEPPFFIPSLMEESSPEPLVRPIIADRDRLLAWFCSIPDSPCKVLTA